VLVLALPGAAGLRGGGARRRGRRLPVVVVALVAQALAVEVLFDTIW
jgi:hypothetical protein